MDGVLWVEFFLVCLMVALTLTGVCGNLLSIAVFSQLRFRKLSINIFLIALSTCDLLLLIFGLPAAATAPLVFLNPFMNWAEMLLPVFTFSAAYLHPVSVMCQSASIWLLGAVTVERWAAVCKPFSVGVYFTRKRAVLTSCSIMCIAVVFNFVKFWEISRPNARNLAPLLANHSIYVFWKLAVSRYLATYLLPLSLLTVLNALVARELARSANLRQAMNATQRNDRTTATMLLYVVIMFICCYTLSLVVQLWEFLNPNTFKTYLGYILSDLNNTLIITNSSTTWIFYLKFSSNYRHGVKELFGKICCRGKGAGSKTATSLLLRVTDRDRTMLDGRPSDAKMLAIPLNFMNFRTMSEPMLCDDGALLHSEKQTGQVKSNYELKTECETAKKEEN